MTKKVLFNLPAEYVADAVSGVLVGEFNNWNPEEGIYLERQEDGSMRTELALSSGRTYEYRYLLSDGRWVNDYSAKTFADVYGYSIENCVIDVPAPVKKAAAKRKSPKADKSVTPVEDLTKIEGIGKKIASLLNAEGIRTYKDLGKSSIKKLQLILDAAGSKFAMHDPATWPKQAKLASTGKWDELATLQETLKGGK